MRILRRGLHASLKKPAVDAFNKLKHGLLFVPSARRFAREWIDAPGMLIKTPSDMPGAEGRGPTRIL